MGKIDKQELQKLTPAGRIKKLKELEEENKKEIEEAGKLIKETEAQIEGEKIAASVAVPETKPVDIEALFREEKGSLETTVKQEAPATAKGEEGTLYQLAQVYEEAKDILYSSASSDEILARVDRLGERLEKIRYVGTSGDQVANLAVATRTIMEKIKKYQLQ